MSRRSCLNLFLRGKVINYLMICSLTGRVTPTLSVLYKLEVIALRRVGIATQFTGVALQSSFGLCIQCNSGCFVLANEQIHEAHYNKIICLILRHKLINLLNIP